MSFDSSGRPGSRAGRNVGLLAVHGEERRLMLERMTGAERQLAERRIRLDEAYRGLDAPARQAFAAVLAGGGVSLAEAESHLADLALEVRARQRRQQRRRGPARRLQRRAQGSRGARRRATSTRIESGPSYYLEGRKVSATEFRAVLEEEHRDYLASAGLATA